MFYVSRFKLQEKGTTLVEIIVVIFIIAIFSSILISNFPKIIRQFALSGSAYKLSQDFRKVQDLGLSGVLIVEEQVGGQSQQIRAKGYGIYFNLRQNTQYIIYADRGSPSDFKYNGNLQLCSNSVDSEADCILETINITDENSDLYIKEIININSGAVDTSINFTPPNPDIAIDNLSSGKKEIGVMLGLGSEPLLSRTVWVNISGLIRVE
ncbi:MAG: hypothetical protein ABIJ84_02880 [bacterium]